MSGSKRQQSRPHLTLLIVAGVAALLFASNIASNLVATDLDPVLKPFRIWVYAVCGVALVVTVALTIHQKRKDDAHPPADVGGDTRVAAPPAEKEREVVVYRARDKAGALHQLPPPPRDFTGREAELKELMARIGQGGVNISGLRGLGGVGKTTLALKLAEQLRPSTRTRSSTST